MTTLIYSNDIIAADSFNVISTGENSIITHNPKVFKSKTEPMAYGVCGEFPYKSFNLEDWVLTTILNTLENKECRFVKNVTFFIIVMYKELTFVISNNDNIVKVTLIERDSYITFGTGGNIATTELLKGNDCITALEKAMLYDSLSGGNIYAVKRSSILKVKRNDIL